MNNKGINLFFLTCGILLSFINNRAIFKAGP